MRHQVVTRRIKAEELDTAAVWPNDAVVPALTIPTENRSVTPSPSTPDVPVGAGLLIVLSYVALLTGLAAATVAPGQSLFAIGIVAFFAVMFFAVPAIFLKIEDSGAKRVSLSQFLRRGMQTYTGHCSGNAALVQMLLVPVALTFGVLCIGLAMAWIV